MFTLMLHGSSTKLPLQYFLTRLADIVSALKHRDGFWAAGLFLLRFMSGIHWSWNHEEHEVVSGGPSPSNTLIVCCHVTVSVSKVLMPVWKVEMEKKLSFEQIPTGTKGSEAETATCTTSVCKTTGSRCGHRALRERAVP